MTIKIIQNPVKDINLNRKYDNTWRQSKNQIIPDINTTSNISDIDVDIISKTMDTTPQSCPQPTCHNLPQEQIGQMKIPTKADIAKQMINQYIKQNGGIIQQDKTEQSNNKLLLG